ncbi:hypothetical protein L596_021252 [Steinernema carpocapsae]|uniref:Uncharacterized protein n=1 Tax=Steinernema carpocapsae TaxID=34508 RepID=A0A4V6A159_STECR|nr:hypothetical protein L596_021247 [Steinernema carpocapsae]TKR74020.1 hypothetical protein L596_021252 [Steinernema carpocapsae]
MPPTGTCLISNISLPRTDVSRRDTENGIPPLWRKTNVTVPPTETCLTCNIALPRTDVSRRDTENGIPPMY